MAPTIPDMGVGLCLRGRPKELARLSVIMGIAAPESSRARASSSASAFEGDQSREEGRRTPGGGLQLVVL